MLEIRFTARCAYTLVPYRWTYRLSLGLIESWRDLDAVARFALGRCGYGNTDSGFGLEYPTRPDRQGMVRFWRWVWSSRGPTRTRKWHFPEADYLAVLVARLRVVGKDAQADELAALGPLPEVVLLPQPDPYDRSNYSFSADTFELRHSTRLILEQRDFALARARATGRLPFALPDGSWIAYGEGGRLTLHLHRGYTQETTEEAYLALLDALARAYQTWTVEHSAPG